jgi:hypothetical protein
MATSVLIELTIKKDVTTSGKYSLEIKVTRYENIQAEIFAFKRVGTEDDFSHVASVSDLTDVNKYAPGPGSPFYLDHNVTLEFDTAKEMLDTEKLILLDVEQLKTNWGLVRDQFRQEYSVIIT